MSMSSTFSEKERVVVYVDGFNLYFGMLEAGIRGKWLDLQKLASALLNENQKLVGIKYFTSRVSNDPDKQKRQITYLEALESSSVRLYFGHYQQTVVECLRCGNIWASFNEKMTDVNIATEILLDAYSDDYDMAMLVSGDSDLVPPIRKVHALFPKKRVLVAFPPKRVSKQLRAVARGSIIIGRKKLMDSQFPDEIVKPDGYVLRKPADWS